MRSAPAFDAGAAPVVQGPGCCGSQPPRSSAACCPASPSWGTRCSLTFIINRALGFSPPYFASSWPSSMALRRLCAARKPSCFVQTVCRVGKETCGREILTDGDECMAPEDGTHTRNETLNEVCDPV